MANFVASAIQIVIGVVLIATGIAAPAGVALIVGGIFSAASVALTADRTEASSDRDSPTFGFSQFRNPVKGDTPIPIIYSATGHKTAPVWLQAFVTPEGYVDETFTRVSADEQQLSGLLAVAEGPIKAIEDLRFNDEPVFSKIEDYAVATGDGSTKKFTLPQSRVVLDTMEVSVDGVLKGWIVTQSSEQLGTGNGSKTTWSFRIPDEIAEEVPVSFYQLNPINRNDAETWRYSGFQSWMVDRKRLIVHTDAPLQSGKQLWIKFGKRTATGLEIKRNEDNEVVLKFSSPPANGAKITATFLRKNIGGVRVEYRLGGEHQLPIWGFHMIRNSFGVQTALAKNQNVTKDTANDVDDVVVNISSNESGFYRQDDEGNTHGVKAQFHIEIKRQSALSTTNTFNDWYRVPDPRGADAASNKAANEFQVVAESTSQKFWSLSIRELLRAYSDKHAGKSNGREAAQALQDFVRGRYTVRLRRTNPVSSDNNTSYLDEIRFDSITEIRDEVLTLPHTALIGFHALGSRKLNGGAPNVTCVVKGIRTVEEILQPGGVDTWTPDETNQSNRVWAAIDLITNSRYGGGVHYSKAANVDNDSALVAAAWLDESVQKGSGNTDTEVRSQLDIVLDTRKSLMEHLRDILLPGRVWAVLRGNVWHFVLDKEVTLFDSVGVNAVPVLYDDTREGRTAQNSLACSHDTIASVPTEVQVNFLDEEKEFQSKQVWVPIEETSTAPRRIRRVTSFGTIRWTEVARYGLFLFHKLRDSGVSLAVGAAPMALDFGVGDVIRVVSNRVGIDGWWRIHRMEFSTDDFFVQIQGKQYVPATYAQNIEKQRIIRDGFSRLLAPSPPVLRAPAAAVQPRTPAASTPVPAPVQSARRTRRTGSPAQRVVTRARARRVA